MKYWNRDAAEWRARSGMRRTSMEFRSRVANESCCRVFVKLRRKRCLLRTDSAAANKLSRQPGERLFIWQKWYGLHSRFIDKLSCKPISSRTTEESQLFQTPR